MSRYCDLCDRSFGTNYSLQQHQEASERHRRYCDDCEKEFDTERALTQHYIQSLRHAYCRFCKEHFDDDDDLKDHNNEQHGYCESCNKVRLVNEPYMS